MSITTLAGLEAAPKTRIAAGGVSFSCLTDAYFMRALGSVVPPATAAISLVAAGSGGGLLSNGAAGFFPYPATDSSVFSMDCAWASTTSFGSVALYDFVWGASGFVANTGSAQAVTGFPALTRPDSAGTGLELFLGVISGAASTSTLVSVDYTSSAGTPSRTASLLFGATTYLGTGNRLLPFKLQDGDKGVQSVESMTIGTSLASAGSLCLLLGRRVAVAQLALRGVEAKRADFFRVGGTPIGDSGALQLVTLGGSDTVNLYADIVLAHG